MFNDTGIISILSKLDDIQNNMNIIAGIFHGVDDMQSKRARNLISRLDESREIIDDNRALQMLDEIQSTDLFNFGQDIIVLIKNIESSQEQLTQYIREMRKLV